VLDSYRAGPRKMGEIDDELSNSGGQCLNGF
jgi:hypothetical protein